MAIPEMGFAEPGRSDEHHAAGGRDDLAEEEIRRRQLAAEPIGERQRLGRRGGPGVGCFLIWRRSLPYPAQLAPAGGFAFLIGPGADFGIVVLAQRRDHLFEALAVAAQPGTFTKDFG